MQHLFDSRSGESDAIAPAAACERGQAIRALEDWRILGTFEGNFHA